MSTSTHDFYDELVTTSRGFETATPSEILRWTFDRFGANVAMACSFEDVALLHILLQQRPKTEIIFLDTLGHFYETYKFVNQIEREWKLNLTRTKPGPDADAWPCGTEQCCALRKVEPLKRAVQGKAAWITAVKRSDAPTRATMPIVSWDDKFGLVKVNPFANWSDDDVEYYLRDQGLPEHPLWAKGYASIGCAAMTLKPAPGADRRSGRWAGLDKDECGLHEA
jgi:phosphoadenosine phosphosulfate reductase